MRKKDLLKQIKQQIKNRNENYEEIEGLKAIISSNSDWNLVKSNTLYVDKSICNFDEIKIYYNQKINSYIQIITNYYTRNASINRIPIEDLKFKVNSKKRSLSFK